MYSWGIPYEGRICLYNRWFLYKPNTILKNSQKTYIHKVYPMRSVAAPMADYFFTNKTQSWKIYKTLFIRDSLWGLYLPQWPIISSQINYNLEKLHKKIYSWGVPYKRRSCLNGRVFLRKLSTIFTNFIKLIHEGCPIGAVAYSLADNLFTNKKSINKPHENNSLRVSIWQNTG